MRNMCLICSGEGYLDEENSPTCPSCKGTGLEGIDSYDDVKDSMSEEFYNHLIGLDK